MKQASDILPVNQCNDYGCEHITAFIVSRHMPLLRQETGILCDVSRNAIKPTKVAESTPNRLE